MQSDRDQLQTAFRRTGPRSFAGYAMDPVDLSRHFVIELLVDGIAIAIVRAEEFDPSLLARGLGHGCYGFSFTLPSELAADCTVVEARIANVGTPVGAALLVHGEAQSIAPVPRRPRVEWRGGLRFTGWLDPVPGGARTITAIIDGAMVSEGEALGWQHFGSNFDDAAALPAFDVHLPTRFADGRVRKVKFVDAAGAELLGSPISFVAFDDALERIVAAQGDIDSERLREQAFRRLFPASLPFAQYQEWSARFALPERVEAWTSGCCAVLLVGNGDIERSLQSLELSSVGWVAGSFPFKPDSGGFDPDLLQEFLDEDASDCEIVVCAACGIEFYPETILRLAAALRAQPDTLLAYSDLAFRSGDDKIWPIAFPAFDYERLLEQGYCAHLFAVPRAKLVAAIQNEPLNLYRMAMALLKDPETGRNGAIHLPGPLAILPDFDVSAATHLLGQAAADHLQRRGVDAEVRSSAGALLPAVRVCRRSPSATISIIILTRNRRDLLEPCLASIEPAAQRSGAEIVVVDNASSDPDALQFLDEIDGVRTRVLRVPGAFNYAKLNNLAAKTIRSDYLCLLNNDVQAADDEWLDELQSRLAEPEVGAVGALLVWPSGVVQHGGVVLGCNLAATHAFNDRMNGDPGYSDLLCIAHECSAVTAACMLTRRSDFEQAGGLDEQVFPIDFNDVDYCLRLRSAGKRVVFTPHAQLLHLESGSRGDFHRRSPLLQRSLANLRARWLETLLSDPFYNPILSLDAIPFSALAWPPRDLSPRQQTRPWPAEIPPSV